MVEEVVMLMKFSVDPALLVLFIYLLYHVLIISNSTQERVLLSLSTLPPSLREVPFDWYGIMGYLIPYSTPFQIRGILQNIVDKVTSTSILSSLTWKYLGFHKLVSATYELLTFHINPSQDPWTPP
jgi:hypothetical protein